MDEREQTRLSYLAGAFWQNANHSFHQLVQRLDLNGSSAAFREAVKILEAKANVPPEEREELVAKLIATKKQPFVDVGRALAWAKEAQQMASRRVG